VTADDVPELLRSRFGLDGGLFDRGDGPNPDVPETKA
jgi:hypothetical protein